MPLETATTIDQLNPNYPLGTDTISDADDHLRLIKSALKNTFPALTGSTNITSTSLDWYEANKAALEAIVSNDPYHYLPPGVILMWSGDTANIPAGWAVCDGTNGTPDLRDRFVLASPDGTTGAVGTSHYVTTTQGGLHDHGGTTGSTALGNDQVSLNTASVAAGNDYTVFQATGNSAGHDHTVIASGTHTHSVDTRGKYYKLLFIMKL